MRRSFMTTILLCVVAAGSLACGDEATPRVDAHQGASADANDKSAAGRGGVAADSGTDAGNHDKGAAGGSSVAGEGGTAAGVTQLSLRFKAQIGNEAFACGRVYDNLGTTKLSATPRDFRFLVQDIQLITRDGKEVAFEVQARAPYQLAEVGMLDFSDGRGDCGGDTETNTEITGAAAAGDYDGIVFSIGVPESLNHQNIALAKPPLQDASLYWGWQNGYRFLLAELLPVNVLADDAGADDAGAAVGPSLIHIGSGGCAGANTKGFSCSRPNRSRVRITGFDPTKRAIIADLGKVFEHIDVALGTQCHGAAPGCAAIFSALGVDFDTGMALQTQSVFRAQ
jgi:uncharacterized repeat protein (TIGR04052 family)